MPGYDGKIPDITQNIQYYFMGLDSEWVVWGIRILFLAAVLFVLISYWCYSKKDED